MVSDEHRLDEYRAFFTTDNVLSRYMANLLELRAGDVVLEPCAGGGALIEAVLAQCPDLNVTAYELQTSLVADLAARYSTNSSVVVHCADTITDENLALRETFGPKFSKIIGNPPYGAWQTLERRADLKAKFASFYVKESYAIFLIKCLRLLDVGGRLVFILPATFLQLHSHAELRKLLLNEYRVDSVDVFPSSFFPGVSFKYADLCILCVTAVNKDSEHRIRMRYLERVEDLDNLQHRSRESSWLRQSEILPSTAFAFPHPRRASALDVSTHAGDRLGDLADCVTGFYSGADSVYLRAASPEVRGAKRYTLIDQDAIAGGPFDERVAKIGIRGPRHFVPILKGGGFSYFKNTSWYVDWSAEAVAHYKSDKKSRYQNAGFYFRRGIGFPMVTSRRPTAAVIENSLFDQSVVGIFPKNDALFFYILAYCNSEIFWDCLRCINPTANNSARYVSKVPVVIPGQPYLGEIVALAQAYYEKLASGGRVDPVAETGLNALIVNTLKAPLRKNGYERAPRTLPV